MSPAATTSRDPVCAMDVEIAGSRFSASHRGLDFHFCSAQCLENFGNNPELYTRYLGLRSGLLPPMPKRRKLPLGPGGDGNIERACRRIGEMMGISQVRAESACLIVDYDLKQATLSQIEAVAAAQGLKFKGGFHALRRWLWRSSESTELGNAAHPSTGACCNKPPDGKG